MMTFRNFDTDKIIGTGLVLTLMIFIVGQLVAVMLGRTPLSMEFGNTIVSCLAGYMGRRLIERTDSNENLRQSGTRTAT